MHLTTVISSTLEDKQSISDFYITDKKKSLCFTYSLLVFKIRGGERIRRLDRHRASNQ